MRTLVGRNLKLREQILKNWSKKLLNLYFLKWYKDLILHKNYRTFANKLHDSLNYHDKDLAHGQTER
jgi:hypothetical protein